MEVYIYMLLQKAIFTRKSYFFYIFPVFVTKNAIFYVFIVLIIKNNLNLQETDIYYLWLRCCIR